jgi:TAP42-like family
VKKGIELLRRCDEMVSKLGLFSSNETKDDVNTSNLKYLLVRLVFPLHVITSCSVVKCMFVCNGFNISIH